MEEVDKLERLVRRPDVILGDPDELVSLSWEEEVNLDCGQAMISENILLTKDVKILENYAQVIWG